MDKDDLMFYGNYADTLLEKQKYDIDGNGQNTGENDKRIELCACGTYQKQNQKRDQSERKTGQKWVARNGVCRTDIPVRYYRRKGCNSFYR